MFICQVQDKPSASLWILQQSGAIVCLNLVQLKNIKWNKVKLSGKYEVVGRAWNHATSSHMAFGQFYE